MNNYFSILLIGVALCFKCFAGIDKSYLNIIAEMEEQFVCKIEEEFHLQCICRHGQLF